MNPGNLLNARSRHLQGVETWERFRHSPNWFRDRIIAQNHFKEQDHSWEVSELLFSEPASDGQRTDEYYFSLMLNTDARRPMEVDIGAGRFLRPNEPGTIVFGDNQMPQKIQGHGPFHSLILFGRKEVLQARMRDILGSDVPSLFLAHSQAIRDDGMEILLKQLLNEYRQGPYSGQKLTTDDLMDGILRRLLSVAQLKLPVIQQEDRLRPVAIQRTIDYMQSHFAEDLNRAQLAQIAGVDPCHFTRLFKQTLGMTPKRYLLTLRIEQAKQLLKSQRGLPIGQIAIMCGFYDHSHLGLEFRYQVGVAPETFRRFA